MAVSSRDSPQFLGQLLSLHLFVGLLLVGRVALTLASLEPSLRPLLRREPGVPEQGPLELWLP